MLGVKKREPTRREVLTGAAAVAATVTMGRAGATPAAPRSGELLELIQPGLTTSRDRIDDAVARATLDRALTTFTGEPDPVRALGVYIRPTDVVGLKVNALASPGHVFHPPLVWHLVEHLQALGVPPGNIVIYDEYGNKMRRAGYRPTRRKGRVRVLYGKLVGYQKTGVPYDATRSVRWVRLLDELTAIVNLHVPKDHEICGVTGALKNMAFGNIRDVRRFHDVIHDAIPWIYGRPELHRKTRLHICDASRVLFNGGPHDRPKWRAAYDALLISEDPVAMDWAVLELVNAHRAARRMPPIEEVKRPRPRPPDYLQRAVRAGLGVDLAGVKWTRVGPDGAAARYQPSHVKLAGSPRSR